MTCSDIHHLANVAWLAIFAAVVCILALAGVVWLERTHPRSNDAALVAVRRRKAIYTAKLAKMDAMAPDGFNNYDRMQHTVEALDLLEEELGG